MAILNYTTSIECEKSIVEILKCLVQHGAHKITTDYDGQNPCALTFCLDVNGQTVAFSLPANFEGVMKAMNNDKKVPRAKCTKEQAIRVSWRILKDWVEAQMAIVQSQLAVMEEVFLPYAITKNGTTVYQVFQKNGVAMLEQKTN